VDDIFREQVMVFTPRGDVRELPVGATPLDFAYHIHTAVGDQSLLAYVNEKPYPLNRPLHDGDRVRIVKSGWARPQRTWLEDDLGFLTTTRARSHVRRWFRRLSDDEATEQGHRLLDEELEQLGLPDWPHAFVAEQFAFDTVDDLYHALGRAELLPTAVAARVVAQNWNLDALRTIGQPIQTQTGQEFVITHGAGRKMRLCRSCNARPGDSIVGVLRTDGTVTVHRENCYSLRPDPLASRTIKLGWGRDGSQEVRIITVEIDVYDRSGLLFEIAELMQEENVNISSVNTMPADDSWKVRLHLDLEINSPRQLVRILHRAHALVNVFSARCLPENWRPAATG
jgi:GTP pyrophosphokinase